MYRLGIDVGGTNTDAVILDGLSNVVDSVKTHTTVDIETGIFNAIKSVLKSSKIDPTQITQAMLGTTQATNAIVERKDLAKVGVIRLGYPATASIVPYSEWPTDMITALSGQYELVTGGYEFDGDPISCIDEMQLRKVLQQWRGKVEAIAAVGVFSALNNDQEQLVAKISTEVLGSEVPVSLSSRIGSIGLLPRENATILNAALFKVINRVTTGFRHALFNQGISQADVYLCQNDGTLMSLDFAAKYPILTIGSGPTNSIRGAAYLAKQKNALVLDIGGTTSDLGVLVKGFPRESSKAVTVGGIQTNFRMPDILSIGLGGGSIVHQDANGEVTVGPDSVGYEITDRAICFGGDTITATDIAVKMGQAAIGDPALTTTIDDNLALKAAAKIKQMLEDAVDKMKTSTGDVDLILVGGGSIIAPETLDGVGHCFTSPIGGVANAIGATIAQIGGQFEKVYQYDTTDRQYALTDATRLAKKQAIAAGAQGDDIEVVEIEEMPLAYAPGDTTRVKVKVIGSLR